MTMAKARTTLDFWDIQVNYGQGWESEIEEFSWLAAKEQLRSYRVNAPQYPVRAVKKRDKLTKYTAEQLADITRQITEAKERHRERRRARATASV
jgi:hypothetical protein